MKIHRARRALSLGLAGLGLGFLATGLPSTQFMQPSSAVAATPANGCAFIDWGSGSDTLNYDQNSKTSTCSQDVDWAVNIVFYNGATINKVKSALNDYYGQIGSTKHLFGKDRGTGFVDDDKGKKQVACPASGIQTRHYRAYADSDDYIYSADWGPLVVATTHWDANECPPIGTRYYGSEEVEQHMAGEMARQGYNVARNYASLLNNEPHRVQGDHTWESNGFATVVDMTR